MLSKLKKEHSPLFVKFWSEPTSKEFLKHIRLFEPIPPLRYFLEESMILSGTLVLYLTTSLDIASKKQKNRTSKVAIDCLRFFINKFQRVESKTFSTTESLKHKPNEICVGSFVAKKIVYEGDTVFIKTTDATQELTPISPGTIIYDIHFTKRVENKGLRYNYLSDFKLLFETIVSQTGEDIRYLFMLGDKELILQISDFGLLGSDASGQIGYLEMVYKRFDEFGKLWFGGKQVSYSPMIVFQQVRNTLIDN
jgi:hypothetical protein